MLLFRTPPLLDALLSTDIFMTVAASPAVMHLPRYNAPTVSVCYSLMLHVIIRVDADNSPGMISSVELYMPLHPVDVVSSTLRKIFHFQGMTHQQIDQSLYRFRPTMARMLAFGTPFCGTHIHASLIHQKHGLLTDSARIHLHYR
ncbi:hypothetical protein FB446DRAFT_185042 [Lentinula raphanica]|nr:hypothetical protein FB446DRAFT_185042 [Lentinula raphanica]